MILSSPTHHPKKSFDFTPIPESLFGSCIVDQSSNNTQIYTFVHRDSGKTVQHTVQYNTTKQSSLHEQVRQYLAQYATKNNVKIVGMDISHIYDDKEEREALAEDLWLNLDIVPFVENLLNPGEQLENDLSKRSVQLAKRVSDSYKIEDKFLDVFQVRVLDDMQVDPTFLVTLDAYKKIVPKSHFDWLLTQAERFKKLGGKIIFLNSTPQGGGVALMRHAIIRILRALGVDARWYVLKPRPEVFAITKKKFHNTLQGISPNSVMLTDEEKMIYKDWIDMNSKLLEQPLKWGNVIVIDDYQPSGLIPYIKEWNPKAKIMYRSHIHIDSELIQREGTPQNITWDFIWNGNMVKTTDIFISHPIKEFVPLTVPIQDITLMAAATDNFDGLNKPLKDDQLKYYLNILNNLLVQDEQKPLDLERPYICQVARFDPSKGIPDVLYSYKELRESFQDEKDKKKIPQLVIAGHGAIDDPEGVPILLDTKQTLSLDVFSDIADDVKLVRLPHNDQILNSIMQGCTVALQLSHREGLEVKVSEALYHGKPIIIYRTGGMPLQVKHEFNSFVVELGETSKVSKHLYDLFTDKKLYEKMQNNAKSFTIQQFFTVGNTYEWLYMANELLEKGEFYGHKKHIDNIMEEKGLVI